MNTRRTENKLEDYLDADEHLIWKRLPGRRRLTAGLRSIRIAGHAMLTVISVFFTVFLAAASLLSILHAVLLGILLVAATNAPLIIWTRCRLPVLSGSGDAVFFLTDKRVGLMRPGGEIRQAPICPGLSMNIRTEASIIEFSLGERTPVTFGGLSREEILLVISVTEGLVGKCK